MLELGNLIESRNKNIAAGVFSLVASILMLSIFFSGDHLDEFFRVMGPVGIAASAINVAICWRRAAKVDSALIARASTVEDRLDKLERLKRCDMVTPKEYATKRQEILKDL